jgi:hypothetical protein
MKTHGPRHGSSGTRDDLPARSTAGGADFAWPPTADDLEGCGIVSLAGDDDETARLRVLVRLPDVLPAGEHRAPTAPARAAAPAPSPARARHWGVEQPAAAYPFHVDGDDPMAPASAGGEVRRAVVAVAAGLSLAFLSYLQFRSARTDASALVTAVAEATTASLDRRGPDPVMEIPPAVVDRIAPPESVGRRLVARVSAIEAADADVPVAATLARLASDVIDEVRAPEPTLPPPVAPSAAAPAPAAPAPAAIAVDTRPVPVPAVADERAAAPVAVVATHVDPIPGDEDRIRAALLQWRTAYSALDARAAREVWPTVDARALERAFQALKSQDLRFDRCDLTVDGGSAQAACSGRATYVPRVGNQSPKATPREWTFELKKHDQRWTIASARAS